MKKSLLAKSILLSVVTSTFLLAQETGYKIEEVTVSANKIEENVQKVPQSISVFDEEIIKEKRIVEVKDVIEYIPNMNFEKALNGSLYTTIRGLNGSTFTMSNPVVIYVDGVPYYDRFDYNPSLLNVKQIEVLRGPQGTLYGKDSIGGVINIITKEPENEWAGDINMETGNYGYKKESFNTSGALIDNLLFAGISGSYFSDDGWITNDYPGMPKNANEKKEKRLNAFALFKPTDNLSTKLTLSHTYNKEYGRNGTNVDRNISINEQKRDDSKHVSFDVPSYIKRKTNSQNFNIDYELDNLKFESVTIHKDFGIDIVHDNDFQAGNSEDGIASLIISDVETWVQELKVSSKNEDIKWVTGLYFDDEKRDQGPYGNASSSRGAANVVSTINTNTYAIFGQMMLPFAKNFELTLGGRYQKVKRDINSNFYNSFTDTSTSLHSYEDSKSWNTFLPKLALSYNVNDDLMLYSSISKGYIPGGFNFYSTSPGSDSSFDSQKSLNYEIGLKYQQDDYTLNASIFRINVEDLHVYTMVTDRIAITSNAEEAHSQGIELDGRYFFNDNLELTASIGFINSKYDDYSEFGIDYSGQRTPNSPKFNVSLGVTYFNSEGFYGNATLKAKGKTGFKRNGKVEETDGGFTADAKLGYKIDNWDVYTYVTNLTDADHVSSFGRGIGFTEPRRFGVGLRYSF